MFGFVSKKTFRAYKKYYAELIFDVTQMVGRLSLEVELLEKDIKKQLHKHRTKLFLSIIVNNQKFLIMDLKIEVNQKSVASLILLDTITGQPVTDAKFSNLVAVSSDPSLLATSEDQAAAVINGVALKAGSGTVQVTALADYTDSNGNQVKGETKTFTGAFTISEVAGGGGTGTPGNPTALDIQWSTPVAR